MSEDWYVYVLLSESAHLTYVGIAKDPDKRLLEHNGELPGGAKFTRRGRPWQITARHGPYPSRSEATIMEARIKKIRGRKRISFNPLLE
jgi:putative endonuclease